MSGVWFFKFQMGLFNPIFYADIVFFRVFARISVVDAMLAAHVQKIFAIVDKFVLRKAVYSNPYVFLYRHIFSKLIAASIAYLAACSHVSPSPDAPP